VLRGTGELDCARKTPGDALGFDRAPQRTVADDKETIAVPLARKAAEAAKEGGFLGFGGKLVSDAETAAINSLASALGVSEKGS